MVFEAEDALPDFEIGHGTTSKTSVLRALTCGDYIYLDTPRMEDTSGSEKDIATWLSLAKSQNDARASSLLS